MPMGGIPVGVGVGTGVGGGEHALQGRKRGGGGRERRKGRKGRQGTEKGGSGSVEMRNSKIDRKGRRCNCGLRESAQH